MDQFVHCHKCNIVIDINKDIRNKHYFLFSERESKYYCAHCLHPTKYRTHSNSSQKKPKITSHDQLSSSMDNIHDLNTHKKINKDGRTTIGRERSLSIVKSVENLNAENQSRAVLVRSQSTNSYKNDHKKQEQNNKKTNENVFTKLFHYIKKKM